MPSVRQQGSVARYDVRDIRIYDQHNLKDASAQRSLAMSDRAIPRIICSEAFI